MRQLLINRISTTPIDPDLKLAKDRPESRLITVQRKVPANYRVATQPFLNEAGRLEVPLNIPSTLTPIGYIKMKLQMALAQEEYQELREQLLKDKLLWCDPTFPADESSIGDLPELKDRIIWKRVRDINPHARFFVDGPARCDIKQGALGDCWLLAVLSSICCYPILINQVVPPEQEVDQPDYVGIFRARFWRFGRWIEVMVDDRLPVYKHSNRLVFMSSPTNNEYWSALCEKAYAKLNGSYASLNGGLQSEAMEDCTGGLAETIYLDERRRPPDLLRMMQINSKRCVVMGCSIRSESGEQKLENGLFAGHAYGVTGIASVLDHGDVRHLVRCRSPWADCQEWRGPWSDRSPEWEGVSAADKSNLQIQFQDDGEFWMSFEDFTKNFTSMEMCHLGFSSLEPHAKIKGRRRLEEVIYPGSWKRNVNAGGCGNYLDTFVTNPQFIIEIIAPDLDDSQYVCSVVIGLMQKPLGQEARGSYHYIGFAVYAVSPAQAVPVNRFFIQRTRPLKTPHFADVREVTERFKVPPGRYIIIPSTHKPNEEADFIVRIITQQGIKHRMLDNQNAEVAQPPEIRQSVQLQSAINKEDCWLTKRFEEVCDQESHSIHAGQLQKIINESRLRDLPNFQPFSIEVCRSFVATMDSNHSGRMELSELLEFWNRIEQWKHAYLMTEEGLGGGLTACQLRETLQLAGFQLSNLVLNSISLRYAHPQTGLVTFEDFIHCCARLKAAFETFEAHPKNHSGEAVFTHEDFLRMTTYP
ncbi:hypothetical protein CRM22_002281 [Opisthorchis felineus]|uniref:Calpain catalytic domain-containing protein n=1 Tax=Opisthorchis felineus TaxID=147828 RepID=A0A4S2M6Z0_OPIFE|nr:hypothetical protein CRM22_002281 [Opisthorchis felineus]